MKKLLLATAATFGLTSAAFAGGLSDPIIVDVVPAVDLSWTGAYAGVSATTDGDFDDATAGAFAGYRWDLGSAVVGAEANAFDGGTYSVEAQLGYDAGKFLPYAAVGYVDANGVDGVTYGVGVDYSFGNGILLGAKFTDNDLPGDNEAFGVRVGFQF